MSAKVRIFLIVFGTALSLVLGCLAFETSATNYLGWFLLIVGIAYCAGGAFYIWQNMSQDVPRRTEDGDRTFWFLLPGILGIFFAPPLEYLYLPGRLPRTITMELIGLLLILLGISLLIWARHALGGSFSFYLQVRSFPCLIEDGPYRLIRHPGYTGLVLSAIGLSIGYSSLIGLAAIPILLIPGLMYRIHVEEEDLIEAFGDIYRSYASGRKRLIPRIW
jgi:protein-S-isoprenylcysteine O-methyltransferase Ste14